MGIISWVKEWWREGPAILNGDKLDRGLNKAEVAGAINRREIPSPTMAGKLPGRWLRGVPRSIEHPSPANALYPLTQAQGKRAQGKADSSLP
jgi:hypothetical protein